jgi:adenine phosphoribosyltransferase
MSPEPSADALKSAIRDVPDFPKPGILFKDITPVLGDAALFRQAIEELAACCSDLAIDKVVAIESRGFILGGALAYHLGVGFVPVRKPGKLPWRARKASYSLEYGSDSLEMHEDAVSPADRVLIVDDVIATGGTAKAVGSLCQELGARVSGYLFLVELCFLDGRARLTGHDVRSLIQY